MNTKNQYRIAEVLRGNDKLYYVPERKEGFFKWVSLLPIDDPGYTSYQGAWEQVLRDSVQTVKYNLVDFGAQDGK